MRIEQGLVEVHGRPEWPDGRNARSRRVIPIDMSMVKALKAYRTFQADERLTAAFIGTMTTS